MAGHHKYKAFISYSHADKKWGDWLHKGLESYRTPKRLVRGTIPARLTPIFRDRDELTSSSDLSARIREALSDSENLIVICSPSAAKSKWVNKEIESFQELGGSDRIFSLIVDGDPAAFGLDTDCFPPAMRSRFDRHGKLQPEAVEPIAADVRKGGDGRTLARLKIIAGLLDIGLDVLRQRESQRKLRRMALVTAGSVALTVMTAILAFAAILARDEATQRRSQAEDLLTFMVGDLRKSLAPIGRLDLLEEVGAKAMDYFATVDLDALTDDELSFQAQVMTQLGEIRVSQLQYDEALASFTEAYHRSEALHLSDRGNGDKLFNRAQAEYWIAFVHWRNGDLAEARRWLVKYRDSGIQLAMLDETRMDWAREVGYGHHNLAVLNFEAGELDAAAAGFEQELEVLYAIEESVPDEVPTIDIADSISWVGNIALARGDLNGALEHYLRSAADLEAFSRESPDDKIRLNDWAHATQRVVEVLLMKGELNRARELADEAMLAFDALTDYDEANIDWLRASTGPRIAKGFVLAAMGQLDEALGLANQCISVLQSIVANGTADYNVHYHLANAYYLATWVYQTNNDVAAALYSSQQALGSLRLIQASDRLNDQRTGKLASIYLVSSELLAAQGDATGAQRAWQQANNLLERVAPSSHSPFLLDPWVRLLILSGRRAEAQELSRTMSAGSYVPLRPWPD
jgi:eukaryotic-like serine/threonine-protein kinase